MENGRELYLRTNGIFGIDLLKPSVHLKLAEIIAVVSESRSRSSSIAMLKNRAGWSVFVCLIFIASFLQFGIAVLSPKKAQQSICRACKLCAANGT